MPRPDLHTVLPSQSKPRGVFVNPQARRYALIAVVLVFVGAIAAVVAARAEASVKPAGYPIPKQCQGRKCVYVADDRCEIEDPDTETLPDGRKLDAYRMLVGYPEFVINRRGQVHVKSIEYIGYNEHGAHAWDRVSVYVRIPGTKQRKSQRVTPVYQFVPADRFGGKSIGRDNGWTVRGLEVVFTGYDRGKSCSVVVSPWDVAWATGGVR